MNNYYPMLVEIHFIFGKKKLKNNKILFRFYFFSAHFHYNSSNNEALSIGINDIFHVTDTLYNGQVGFWVATKLNVPPQQTKITGAIPNKSRYILIKYFL